VRCTTAKPFLKSCTALTRLSTVTMSATALVQATTNIAVTINRRISSLLSRSARHSMHEYAPRRT
jgi:hypothetical protein